MRWPFLSVEVAIIRCKEEIKNATELYTKNTAELDRKVSENTITLFLCGF